MLTKLLKHEFRATARIMGPLYLVLLAVALGFNFSARLMDSGNFVLNMLAALVVMAYVVAITAVFIVAFILMLQRFYKNLLGDEGYLMFTLPASVSQHITAKLVVAVLLDVLSVAAAILAVLALALDGTMWLDLPGDFFDMIVYVDWSDWLLLLELLLLCLAAGAVGMLHIYASIAVGHLARKHRTLAAFGAYFGFAVALNILFTGMLEIFVSSPWMAEIGRWFMELKGDTGGHLLMWLLILGIAVLGAGFFALTRYLLKNHLNLE